MRIVLASASPRRRALLSSLGTPIEVIVSHAPEEHLTPPDRAVVVNARAKRDEVARQLDAPALVIAADTLVVLGERVLGKPADAAEAAAMLRELSGHTHRVVTGVAVIDTATGRMAEGCESTEVTFRDLAESEIQCFIEAVNPVDRAGAYTVDGPGTLLVARYNGCYQNVLGLPMIRLDALLRAIGHNLFEFVDPACAQFL